MPLIIHLHLGYIYQPDVVQEIHDCSKHMADGGKKDAKYIAGLFQPHLDDMELLYHDISDVIFLTSTVQTAGQVIQDQNHKTYNFFILSRSFLY
jgi:hypothetical protein